MNEALAGLKVVDLSAMIAAPYASMILADFGASVTTIEPPEGCSTRHLGWEVKGDSLFWRVLGRNKESLTLNLKDERGRALAQRLIDSADVLVENMRPGKLEALGLEPNELLKRNPKLVILRVTGYGQTGPYSPRAAFGTQAEAHSGFAHCNGYPDGPPTLPSFPLADAAAGYHGAMAIMLALTARERDPQRRGQIIDLSLVETLFGLLGPQASVYQQFGEVQTRLGNSLPTACPRNLYLAKDGKWVAVSCTKNEIALRTFSAIGRDDLATDPRYFGLEGRLANATEIDRVMQDWIGQHDAEFTVNRFSAAGAAASMVYDIEDILADPHYQHRQMVVTADTADIGPLQMQNVAPRLSLTPGKVRWTGKALGADTDAILSQRLGLTRAQIDALRRDSVI